MNKQK